MTPLRSFTRIFRAGKPPEEGQYPGFRPGSSIESGMVIERDVAVVLRDGVTIYVDVFRPEALEPVPALIAWSPYGKHPVDPDPLERFPDRGGVPASWVSRYAKFEAPDPAYWVPHGYAVVNPDTRGSWNSEGDGIYWSGEEGLDFHDVIEWAGTQPWSNGKVGSGGVSHPAISQWYAAATRPPHLAAINPWEGLSDVYREFCFHGGIPDTVFPEVWNGGDLLYSRTRVEDFVAMMAAHPLWDDYWETKAAALARIEVPAYVVASWSDHGLHTRGTLEGFKQIASQHKWLEVHGRRKWEYYYQPASLEKQRQFFDHFLKGTDDAVLSWPPVLLEVRERSYVGALRAEREWPLARTSYTRLYLDAETSSMSEQRPEREATARYAADAPSGRVALSHEFASATELTGHMKLHVWVEAAGSDDLDLFVAVEKIGVDGEHVEFPFYSAWFDGGVALGWLRVSHRELDHERTTEYQPWHLHQREMRVVPGEVIPVEIEILPSSTAFAAGEQLQLVISGADIHHHMSEHADTRNRGEHVIHTGGRYDSYLLVPVITGD
jgi:predicted acyl esterase